MLECATKDVRARSQLAQTHQGVGAVTIHARRSPSPSATPGAGDGQDTLKHTSARRGQLCVPLRAARTDGPHAWDLQHRSPAGIPRTRWNPSYEYFSSGANCMIVAMSTPPSLMLASAGQVVIRTEKITVLQCLTLVISFTERPDGCTGDWMDDELPTQE